MTMMLSVARRLLVGGVVWWAIIEGDTGMIGYGVVAVVLSVAVSFVLTGRPEQRRKGLLRRLAHAAALVGWVLARSVSGGVDVARRALRLPRTDVDPYWRTYTADLASDGERAALALIMNLMPGTLSAKVDGEVVDVHVISPAFDVDATLQELERRIAAVTGPRG